jgi:hypothetical protein
MGLINNDVYRCANGVQKEGTYISFGTETLYLCQSSSNPTISAADRVYNVRANYRVYWDKSCRDGNMPFLDLQSVSTHLTAAQLESNLYGALYEALKLVYPNCTDDLRAVAPAAAPSEPVAAPSEPAASEPAAAPSEPAAAPSEPAAAPSEPAAAPSEPAAAPSEPSQ